MASQILDTFEFRYYFIHQLFGNECDTFFLYMYTNVCTTKSFFTTQKLMEQKQEEEEEVEDENEKVEGKEEEEEEVFSDFRS